jgi:ribosomal protein L24
MVEACVGDWHVIQGGKYKGQDGMIIRFTPCKVVLLLLKSNSTIMIEKRSLLGKNSASEDGTCWCPFVVGAKVALCRGKYSPRQGLVTKIMPCMLQVTLEGCHGMSVRVRKSSALLLLEGVSTMADAHPPVRNSPIMERSGTSCTRVVSPDILQMVAGTV